MDSQAWVEHLAQVLRRYDLEELEMTWGNCNLHLKRRGSAQVAPSEVVAGVVASPPVEETLHCIYAPMVGTFYASPSPSQPAYVQKGDRVERDSVVCILEAMKVMNEIMAECSGEIVEILGVNGHPVEYGQPLFRVRPDTKS